MVVGTICLFANWVLFCSSALREDKYYVAGCGIAVSLVHGGPAPGFLSPTFFSCLVNGPDSAIPVMEDIADADLYESQKGMFISLVKH